MNQKKIRKLIRDPKLFFSDMLLKRNKSIDKLKPKIMNGTYKYTIVSAVYNVSNYLEAYFESIVTQRLDFEKNIFLVMVDDGSIDNSADIIKKWQKKFPNNIKYIYKDNGGQASARNIGLDHVNTEWVTFIDPDDFIDINYFLSVDKFASKKKHETLDLISCNFIFYFEDKNQIKDSHPLKYRFANGDIICPVENLGKNIQLSVNSAIFKYDIISKNNIKFNDKIKPNFEDAHFASNYFMYIQQSDIAFLKSAKYLYRKRSDGSSTLDKSWEKPGLYDQVLELGCLDLLKKYSDKKGNVPENIQITVIYHLIWYFKKILNNKYKLDFLSSQQQERFISLLDEIFSYIDETVIMSFNLAGAWFFHKVGMLGAFKNINPSTQIVYIESYDRVKKMAQLRYFSHEDVFENIEVSGKNVFPNHEKHIQHSFLNRKFTLEKRIWVKVGWHEKLKINISGIKTNISLAGKQYSNGITGESIIRHFDSLIPEYVTKSKRSNAWILMDRDYQADDNAEHLYRYISKYHPEQEIYFALNQTSHDWNRLKNEGFNLINFGSEEHILKLQSCSKVISSHVDYCVVNLLGPRMLSGRHFVFLQHGVTKDDLSAWLNQKENIDCFITASKDEYESIISNNSKYKYSSKEVKLTGFPRHDSLLSNIKSTNQILVMPTWRANISGEANRSGHERTKNPEFMSSNFAIHWNNFFNSQQLKDLSEKYNYNVVVYPHPNLLPYIDQFSLPEYITLQKPSEIRIQDLFNESSLLITDYSSVAFELAIQNKQTIYYQFDEEDVFAGTHTYSKGYYEYRKHGFGPVCNELAEVFSSLEILLSQDAQPTTEVLKIIEKTFPFRDGKSCERTYNAIIELDKTDNIHLDIQTLHRGAIKASIKGDWINACGRWNSLFTVDSFLEKATHSDIINFSESLLLTGKPLESIKILDFLDENISEVDKKRANVIKETFKLSLYCIQDLNFKDQFFIANNINNEIYSIFINALNGNDTFSVSPPEHINIGEFDFYLNVCKLLSIKSWDKIEELHNRPNGVNVENKEIRKILKLISLLSLKNTNNHNKLKSCLINDFSKHEKDSIWWMQYVSISHMIGEHTNVINAISPLQDYYSLLPPEVAAIYLSSLRKKNKSELFIGAISNMSTDVKSASSVRNEIAEFFFQNEQWVESSENWLLLSHTEFDNPYKLAYSYRMLGMIEEGYNILVENNQTGNFDVNYWLLRSELSQIMENWDDVVFCWNSIIRLHTLTAPKDAILRLQNAQLMRSINKLAIKET
ncbi:MULTISPECIES: CDP-glycerol glycerophosphotransferase family protein [unclassified Pantoea]|uniref:CDP-glycerol glycerophosphotransferase family protein n=1 Tax=unclassified Pantoea TaxID=2630326 RepID=UPI001CD336D2|nr:MULTISPECIES: CDP-glycerol glycerophosphotransferase family protein [unclassified Pantoea]MCA1178221.1 CDP-glycerol glycerophosphotransferase family protein [Pantoea sp. alder69]MCA1251927.1 CDP-glycerol glycerophosphotransferase family protein [Pantoea sp. alder70]MCA1266683.1 CDP-glycerol glycerophosphotransferase family protein [Pantoea sp. alder81]